MKQLKLTILFLGFTFYTQASLFTDSTYLAHYVIPIIDAADDTEQGGDGSIYFGSTDIEMAYDPDNGNQTIGLRFQNIPIPQGAEIQEAYIQFTVDEANPGFSNLYFRVEATDDALPYQDQWQNISSRPTTNGLVYWSPEEWQSIGQSDSNQRTENLAPIIQEVINRPGWNIFNSLGIIISGTGTRNAIAFETNPDEAAKLILKIFLPTSSEPVSGLIINEVVASNGNYLDEAGESDDWIELYNNGQYPINIGGLFLSDDQDELDKWQIQLPLEVAPNDFAIIWADDDPEQGGLHANFKLKSEGETIYLSQLIDGEIILLDEITYPELALNLSYGRQQDGSDDWIIFGTATPKSSNNSSGFFLDQVIFSKLSGFYQGIQNISITPPLVDATIHYTLDGSIPNQNDLIYESPLSISSTVTLRATAFKDGYAPGKINTANYIINQGHTLPVITITTDPENLWSDENGMYVVGTNGVSGWCWEDPANWNQEWERPATIHFFEDNSDLIFQKEAGIKIAGGCSRTQAQKSFNIYFRPNTYGDDLVEYELFPDLGIDEFQRFKLRDGGQDFGAMMIRDGLNQSLLYNQVDIDLMAYRPVTVYLNGEYWGIYGMREFYTKHYIKSHFGIEEDNLDMLVNPTATWNTPIKEGDRIAFEELYQYFETHNLENPAYYEYVESQIDIDEYINYHIVQIYLANYDWPSNNVVTWKPRDGGKWRWMLFDTDSSADFPLWGQSGPNFNSIEFATSSTSTNWPNHQSSTLMLRKLLANETFKQEFLQRMCTFMETIYAPERVNHFTDSIAMMVEPEMERHISKWGSDSPLGWGNAVQGSVNNWRQQLDRYKSFFVARPVLFRNHLSTYFGLSERSELSINHTEGSHGEVYFHSNEMRIPYQYQGEYFDATPIKIKAVPNPGYSFLKWKETGNTNAEIDFVLQGDFTLTPIFVHSTIFMTEIHFDPAEGEDHEFIEFYNPSDIAFNISDFQVSGAVDFTFPVGTIIAPGDYVLVVKNTDHFASDECTIFEWDAGQLDNSGATIRLENSQGESISEISYGNNFSYFSEAGGTGKSLQLLDVSLSPTDGQNWIALTPSACLKNFEYRAYENEDLLFELFPNPMRDWINIRYAYPRSNELALSVYNAVGQVVYQFDFRGEPYEKMETLLLKNLAAGVYIFELRFGDVVKKEKVVVQ